MALAVTDLKEALPLIATVNEQLPAFLPLTVKPLAVLVTEQVFALVVTATESPSVVFALMANALPVLTFVAITGGAGVSSDAAAALDDEFGCDVTAGVVGAEVIRGAVVVAGADGASGVDGASGAFDVGTDNGFAIAVHSV